MSMKKAIVTGSAGFIGGHLTQALLSDGWSVFGIDNLSSGLQSTFDLHLKISGFSPAYLDICESNHLAKIESIFI